MTVALSFSPDHTTRDKHSGQYVTVSDALTGRTLGRFQVVTMPCGTQGYRALDGTAYPSGIDSTGAIRFAMAEQTKRRAARPPRPPKPPAPPAVKRPRQKVDRFSIPPRPVAPMRRLLVDKLAARQGKAVA